MHTALTITSLLLEDEPEFNADEYMAADPVSDEQRALEKLGFKQCPTTMVDDARGDKAWQRQQGAVCVYAYYDATRRMWKVTGTIFVMSRQEWYTVTGGKVNYVPLTDGDFADVLNRMQTRCCSASMIQNR